MIGAIWIFFVGWLCDLLLLLAFLLGRNNRAMWWMSERVFGVQQRLVRYHNPRYEKHEDWIDWIWDGWEHLRYR